jgi:hypothetical protein
VGHLDLEAIEMAVRSAMHHAGATALSELLQFPVPPTEQRTLPCACGQQASYRELRSKPVLTAVGQLGRDSAEQPVSVKRKRLDCVREWQQSDHDGFTEL